MWSSHASRDLTRATAYQPWTHGEGHNTPCCGDRVSGSGTGGVGLGDNLVERFRSREGLEPRQRPHHHEGATDDLVGRHRAPSGIAEMRSGIRRQEPVVAHDPKPTRRNLDIEPGIGWLVAGIEVSLFPQRNAVHGYPPLGVTARHPVAGYPDHTLYEVFFPRRRRAKGTRDRTQKTFDRIARLGVPHFRGERVESVEDDDVASVDGAEMINELVDEHPIAHQEGVLHRLRRDEKRLYHEGLDDQGETQGQQHESG